jgi:hypothetical protein
VRPLADAKAPKAETVSGDGLAKAFTCKVFQSGGRSQAECADIVLRQPLSEIRASRSGQRRYFFLQTTDIAGCQCNPQGDRLVRGCGSMANKARGNRSTPLVQNHRSS